MPRRCLLLLLASLLSSLALSPAQKAEHVGTLGRPRLPQGAQSRLSEPRRAGGNLGTPRQPPPPALYSRAAKFKIAVNILLWWTLNVIFNLCNKHCLNTWPHPWALATSYWLIGSLCMVPLYLPLPIGERAPDGKREWVAVRQVPRLSIAELRAVMPVVALLCVGHATSTLAPAYGTVAFSNIIKTAEPLFTCVFSYLFYRRTFSLATYVSLLLVVSGVVLFST